MDQQESASLTLEGDAWRSRGHMLNPESPPGVSLKEEPGVSCMPLESSQGDQQESAPFTL